MYCQPPLQSWGTFSLEKKGLIFLRRSTGRFSRGVSALLGSGGRAGRRAKCYGDRKAWSQGACSGFISAAMPPPRPQRGTRTCTGTRLSLVSGSAWPLTAGLCRLVAAAQPLSLSCSVSRLSPVNPSRIFFPFYSGQEEDREKSHKNPALPSLFPLLCASMAQRET